MKTIGIMIRKVNKTGREIITNPDREELKKQIKTFHRKLKKNDKVITYFSIESDTNRGGKYHSHLLIRYNNEINLYNGLSRFIGGNFWEERKNGLDPIKSCKGRYGEVDTHFIYDENGFKSYMNKNGEMETPLI
ncbi:hypothetical protein [uncultured Zobellia sp.]|uniref:hypothetical protein n=1 Tax=uncultured Zobellia sp. TaxID=255433 RepID=UPI002597F1B0|nr:hypothetical protein [uncultured Zobellia sp.]